MEKAVLNSKRIDNYTLSIPKGNNFALLLFMEWCRDNKIAIKNIEDDYSNSNYFLIRFTNEAGWGTPYIKCVKYINDNLPIN